MALRIINWFSSVVGLFCAAAFGWLLAGGHMLTHPYWMLGLLGMSLWLGSVMPTITRLAAVLALNKLGYTVRRHSMNDWGADKPGYGTSGHRSPEALYQFIGAKT